mmetsp:Transcript_41014/g.85387  ORF Transcript_41014/g.85387 Transcript_41014/m.85387 type:complete len:89 (+) Transcript_41014:1-267(+)
MKKRVEMLAMNQKEAIKTIRQALKQLSAISDDCHDSGMEYNSDNDGSLEFDAAFDNNDKPVVKCDNQDGEDTIEFVYQNENQPKASRQ